MKIPLYQIDAFTNKVFGGNPAAVCPLEKWLADDVLQNVASENNLAETAFFVPKEDKYEIRWFTPKVEIDLAGHPTLAAAYVLYQYLNYNREQIHFLSNSGNLYVTRTDDLIHLNFPAMQPKIEVSPPPILINGLKKNPLQIFKTRDYLAVFAREEDIVGLTPDFNILSQLDCIGIIVTAPGKKADFVSRCFAPAVGINEDPVTGSAHSTLIPYWAKKLKKNTLHAYQLSKRRGEIFCKYLNDRVQISGRAVTYLIGEIEL